VRPSRRGPRGGARAAGAVTRRPAVKIWRPCRTPSRA